MNISSMFYAVLLLQAGPIGPEAVGENLPVPDKEMPTQVETAKFGDREEPIIMLQNVPSAVDIRIQQAMEEIVSHTGVKSNFTVAPANIANALAYINSSGARLLLYNPTFMENVHARVCKDWGVYGVVAHEVGHHLQGHIMRGADMNFHQLELEADEFAGFVLYRMGATLEEAQRSTANLSQPQDTATHPGTARRLEAIKAGWMRARGIAADEFFNDERRRQREATQRRP